MKDLILTAFGEESAAIVESFADKLVVMKSVMKVLELLKAVQFEEVSMSIVNNEFVPEHVKLHRGRKTVLGFVVGKLGKQYVNSQKKKSFLYDCQLVTALA